MLGGVTIRPVLSVRAGVTAAGVSRLAAIGVSLNETGTKSVDLRWALNGTAPALNIVTRGASESLDTNAEHVALALLGVAASMASGIALPVLRPNLPQRAIDGLKGVLFAVSGVNVLLDPTFFTDLLDPQQLFVRLKRLAWNLATLSPPLSVTIQDVVKISLAAQGTGTTKRLGVTLTLVGAAKRLELVSGNPNVAIELTDVDWITGAPVAPGLTITVLNGQVTSAGDVQLAIDAGLTIAGIALSFSKGAGPLLELGPVSLDGIAVHMFGEISSAGIGAGVQLELTGLAIAPAGAGGNPVAGGILGDAARGGANNRPAFSPAVAVQARAGGSVDVSVRAGKPPGPWWRSCSVSLVRCISSGSASTVARRAEASRASSCCSTDVCRSSA